VRSCCGWCGFRTWEPGRRRAKIDNRVEIVVGAQDNTKLDLDALKARLTEIGKRVETARVGVKGDKEATYALDKMALKLDSLGRRVSSPKISLQGAARAGVEITGLDLALGHLDDKLSASHGSVVSGANRALSALGNMATSGIGFINPLTIGIGVLAAIMAGPLIAAIGAITVGFAAFGAGAIGEISKVLKAHEKLLAAQQAYEKATTRAGRQSALKAEQLATEGLTGSEKGLLGMLTQLQHEFGKLEKAARPEVVQAFASALHLLKDLLPALRPLAVAAGKALVEFEGSMIRWVEGPSGRKFLAWMRSDGPKAIERFGHVMWDVAQGVGRTFAWLDHAGKTWWHNFDRLVHDVETGTRDLVHAFGNVDHAFGNTVHAGENVVHAYGNVSHAGGNLAHAAGNVIHAFGNVMHAAGNVAHAIENIVNAVSNAIGAFGSLASAANNALGGIPGKLLGALGFEHGGITGAAGGGPRSRLTMVGEHGRELVRLPPGAYVHSNPDTERMMGGGGGGRTTVVFQVAGSSHLFDLFMLDWLRNQVQVHGGGDVQVAIGTSG
jgi:hypothetical protein